MEKRANNFKSDYVWVNTTKVPTPNEIESGDYRELAIEQDGYKYQRRVINNVFTRIYFRFYFKLKELSFWLGVLSPTVAIVIIGIEFNLSEFFISLLVTGIFVFQLYFLTHKF